jgi:TPR repeat protein
VFWHDGADELLLAANLIKDQALDFSLSFKVSVRGLNYPLYDGNVSPTARLSLASGKLDAAFREYERLAELGSGKARCILAYAYLLGSRLTPRDLSTARKIALTAVSSEPGFSNFILACVELEGGEVDSSLKLFFLSGKSGFLPALSAGAKLFSNRYCSAERDLANAETALVRAIRRGHIPAISYLSVFYVKTRRGLLKRLIGIIIWPIGVAAFYLAWRFCIFSAHTFCYHPSNRDLFK